MIEAEDRRRVPVLSAIGIAALVLFAIVATIAAPGLEAPVFPNPHASPMGTAGAMCLCSIALGLWGVTVFYRCSDSTVRRNLVAIDALLSVWIIIAMVKYTARVDAVVAYAWYAYSIPLAFVPYSVFLNAIHVTSQERAPGAATAKWLLCAGAVAICLLSFTNDYHHLLFELQMSNPSWDTSYRIGPLYWAVFAWAFVVPALSLLIVLTHSRVRLRIVIGLVFAFGLLAAVFGLTITLNEGTIADSNVALGYTLFIVVLLETCLQTGILPSYLRFATPFFELPLDLKLLVANKDTLLATAFKTDRATQLTPEEKLPVAHCDTSGITEFRVPQHENVLYKAYRIFGGFALLKEDASELDAERKLLEQRQTALLHQNELLERKRQVSMELERQERERELFEDIEGSLRETTASIQRLLGTLPPSDTPEHREQRRHQLMLVKLLVAYCKRKGSLVLASKGGADFDRDRLMLVLNEMSTDLRTAGGECAAIVEVDRPVPARVVNVVYDALYDFVTIAFQHDNPVVMIFVHNNGSESITLRATMENDSGENLKETAPASRLASVLDQRGVPYELEGGTGALRLRAVVPTSMEVE